MRLFSFLFALFVFCGSFQAQTDTINNTEIDSTQQNRIKPYRLALVGGSFASMLGVSYWYVQKMWWTESTGRFSFDSGRDLVYAKNVDKGGHFFGGMIVADITQWNLRWSGLKEKNAHWYGVANGVLLQFGIEMKDAFAPAWGFSMHDFAAGTAGSFVPILNRYWKPMEYIDFKFSYYPKTKKYWELVREQRPSDPAPWYAWQDDYINQTYWVTIYPLKSMGIDVGLSFGYGLDDSQYIENRTKMGGRNEFYISFDYDLEKVLKHWDTPFAKRLKHSLNYIKVPSPTFKIGPTTKFYPLYF